MSHYLLELHQIELLQLDADFHQDDNGKIWLFNCKNIIVREPKARPPKPIDFKQPKEVPLTK
jgi:hypothetical protein